MQCIDCKFWGPPEVVVGSRRVIGMCDRPGGPDTGDDGIVSGPTYETWDQCIAGEAHDDRRRLEVFGRSVTAQNEALTFLYPNGARRQYGSGGNAG